MSLRSIASQHNLSLGARWVLALLSDHHTSWPVDRSSLTEELAEVLGKTTRQVRAYLAEAFRKNPSGRILPEETFQTQIKALSAEETFQTEETFRKKPSGRNLPDR